MGLVRGSITHASGADGQSGCLRVWLAATSAPCYTLRLSSIGPFAPLTTHRRFCCLQMGRTFAVYLVDRHQVCSATEWSGCFVSRTRYREVNVAHNEGHAAAVRTGHTRHWCACTPRGRSEACGALPTTAFPLWETLDKAGHHVGRRPAERGAVLRKISRPPHPADTPAGERAVAWGGGRGGCHFAARGRRRQP